MLGPCGGHIHACMPGMLQFTTLTRTMVCRSLTSCHCSSTDLHVQCTEQGGVHMDLGGVIGRVAKGGDDEGPVRPACLLQGCFQQEHAVVVCVSFS